MAYMDPNRLVMNRNGGVFSGLTETLAYGSALAGMFQVLPTFWQSSKKFGLAIVSFTLFVVTMREWCLHIHDSI